MNDSGKTEKFQHEAEKAALLAKNTTRNVIAFASYTDNANRKEAEEIVSEAINDLGVPVATLDLGPMEQKQFNIPDYIQSHTPEKRHCILVRNLEAVLLENLRNLNMNRELFLNIPHFILFFVNQGSFKMIMQDAPDFFSWHREVFDFKKYDFLSDFDITQELLYALDSRHISEDKSDIDSQVHQIKQIIYEEEKQNEKDYSYLGMLYKYIAILHSKKKNPDLAKGYIEKSIKCYDRIDDKSKKISSMFVLTTILYDQGKTKKAIELLEEELNRDNINIGKGEIANYNVTLGLMCMSLKDIEKSMLFLEKALGFYKSVNDRKNMSIIYMYMGLLYIMSEKIDEAKSAYQISLNIAKDANEPSIAVDVLLLLGDYYLQLYEYENSMKCYKEAEVFIDKEGYEARRYRLYMEYGKIMKAQKRYEAAYNYYKRALDVIKTNNKRDIGLIYASIGDIELEKNNTKEALQYYTKAYKHLKNYTSQSNVNQVVVQIEHFFLTRDMQTKKELAYLLESEGLNPEEFLPESQSD